MFGFGFLILSQSANQFICAAFGCKVVDRHFKVVFRVRSSKRVFADLLFMCTGSLGRVNVFRVGFGIRLCL